jgi:hypothetical protein
MNANQTLSKLSELNTDLVITQQTIFALKFKLDNEILESKEKANTHTLLENAEIKAAKIIYEAREMAKIFLNVTN